MSRGDQRIWRIAKHTVQYQATDLSGGAAKAKGGRWNSKGKAVVYAASTIALATLETLVHLGDNITIRNAFLVKLIVPASVWKAREIIEASNLDITWMAEPAGSTTINFGDFWLESVTSPLLLVPSVIVPEEYNVLINPMHPKAAKIRAEVARRYIYDPRL